MLDPTTRWDQKDYEDMEKIWDSDDWECFRFGWAEVIKYRASHDHTSAIVHCDLCGVDYCKECESGMWRMDGVCQSCNPWVVVNPFDPIFKKHIMKWCPIGSSVVYAGENGA